MSGTPVQNNLLDFVGLFRFLRLHPYDDPRKFDQDILGPWAEENVDESVARLKKLLSLVMIRRLKRSAVKLPARTDCIIRLPFDSEEERYYRKIERPVLDMLDIAADMTTDRGNLALNTMQHILKLRMACNLGICTSVPISTQASPSTVADPTLDIITTRLSLETIACEQCLHVVETPTNDDICSVAHASPTLYYSSCCRVFCSLCSEILRFQTPTPCTCESEDAFCALKPVSAELMRRLSPTSSSESSHSLHRETLRPSSKVRALLAEIAANLHEKR